MEPYCQVMSAGTGVTHSEFNHSATDPLWLLQIWLLPDASGHDPSYADRTFSIDERHNVLRLLASGGDGLPSTWGAFVLSGEWR